MDDDTMTALPKGGIGPDVWGRGTWELRVAIALRGDAGGPTAWAQALCWFALETRVIPCEPCRGFTNELFVRFVRSARPTSDPESGSFLDKVYDDF